MVVSAPPQVSAPAALLYEAALELNHPSLKVPEVSHHRRPSARGVSYQHDQRLTLPKFDRRVSHSQQCMRRLTTRSREGGLTTGTRAGIEACWSRPSYREKNNKQSWEGKRWATLSRRWSNRICHHWLALPAQCRQSSAQSSIDERTSISQRCIHFPDNPGETSWKKKRLHALYVHSMQLRLIK